MKKHILRVNGMQLEFDSFTERNSYMNSLLLEGMNAPEMERWVEDSECTACLDYSYDPKPAPGWEQY